MAKIDDGHQNGEPQELEITPVAGIGWFSDPKDPRTEHGGFGFLPGIPGSIIGAFLKTALPPSAKSVGFSFPEA